MQMNEISRGVRIVIEVAACAVNGLLFLALYVAEVNQSSSRFSKTGFGLGAQVLFLAGVLALVLVLALRWKIQSFAVRWAFITVLTFWNQACLAAFLVSTMPFNLR